MPTKRYKIPEQWNADTSRILEEMLEEIYQHIQSKYFDRVSAKPGNNTGQNGEIRIDEENSKIYVKIKGSWKEASLT